MIKRWLALLCITIAPPLMAQGAVQIRGCADSRAQREVCAVDAQLVDAFRRNAADAIADIYADDLVLINFRGTRVDKTGVLGALRSSQLRFDSLAVLDAEVRAYGTTAIVTGRHYHVAREPGPDTTAHAKQVAVTKVYVMRNGKWQLVSMQITPIAAAAPPPSDSTATR
jgi:ketosteroid isomerase-like protein